MRLILRVRKSGESRVSKYELDEKYTVKEVQTAIDNAAEKRVDLTLMPKEGTEPLLFAIAECEILSVSVAGFKFPKLT